MLLVFGKLIFKNPKFQLQFSLALTIYLFTANILNITPILSIEIGDLFAYLEWNNSKETLINIFPNLTYF
jgi:hypothetical protein